MVRTASSTKRRSTTRAAKIYYTEIVKKYPQTELAKRSEVRLAAIGPLPDNPPDYFKFLAIVFDHEDPDKQKRC